MLEPEEQRKVLHHVAYFPATEALTHLLSWLAMPLGGLSPRAAVYAINGVLTVLNIVMFTFLLQRFCPEESFAFVLLYAFSLSTSHSGRSVCSSSSP